MLPALHVLTRFPLFPFLLCPTLYNQAYSMVLASSPSRKVNISFTDPALRAPAPGSSYARRNSHTPQLMMLTPSSSRKNEQQRQGGSQERSRPRLTSPTQKRVRSLSSASSLSRGRTAPLRAVCLYNRDRDRRVASTGRLSREQRDSAVY